MPTRLCLEIDKSASQQVGSAVQPDVDLSGKTKLRRCLVGFGDEVRAGVLVPSPAGMICSLPVEVGDEDEHDR